MDLAIYISELLGLKGEVNVPGIGFFQQKRIGGYYNDNEKKFYPPRHEIIFDPQPKEEDEGLAAYISTKKNISPASAKYFIEKYTTGLKAQAAEQKVDITGLGHLFYEYSLLTFRADKAYETNDPSFYGFAPVKANKSIARAVPVEKPAAKEEPVIEKTAPEPVVVEPVENTRTEEDKAYTDTRSYIPQEVVYEEEVESPHRNRTWVIMLLLVIVTLLGFGVSYQYKPEWFGKKRASDTTIIIKGPAPVKKDTSKATKDTTSPAVLPESTVKAPVDTYAVVRYEILAGAFPTEQAANAQIEKYKKLGLKPLLLTHAHGKLNKITLGTYFDQSTADKVADSIITAKKFARRDIYVQQYNPIKK